jgi:hypothetical protein
MMDSVEAAEGAKAGVNNTMAMMWGPLRASHQPAPRTVPVLRQGDRVIAGCI